MSLLRACAALFALKKREPEGEVLSEPYPLVVARMIQQMQNEYYQLPIEGGGFRLISCERLNPAGSTIARYAISALHYRGEREISIRWEIRSCETSILSVRRRMGDYEEAWEYHPLSGDGLHIESIVRKAIPWMRNIVRDAPTERELFVDYLAFVCIRDMRGNEKMRIVGNASVIPPVKINCSSDGTHAPDSFGHLLFSFAYPFQGTPGTIQIHHAKKIP
jgi:hypothetical protein